MRIVEAGYQIMTKMDLNFKLAVYCAIEDAGRTCYKTRGDGSLSRAAKFVQKIVQNGHEAMLEHASMTVRFIVDRGVSHEIVRHRLASFAQESTRYCNYSADRFGREITFIRPCFFLEDSPSYNVWATACAQAENAYFELLEIGETPEKARAVLPNSLKTEIIMTANIREWRHFLKLRAAGTTGKPHPQMRQVALPLLMQLTDYMPELFGDIAEVARNG